MQLRRIIYLHVYDRALPPGTEYHWFTYVQDERAFTPEEEEKLQVALHLEARELELVLDTSSFILQQVALSLAVSLTR